MKASLKLDEFEKFSNPDLLPDGSPFEFWDCTTDFTRTIYVDGNHPDADDGNEGTEARPFKTIRRAAALVQPGERVLIKKGRYFETIRDVKGGTDAAHMVLFEGEDGAVITGAIPWTPCFVPSEGYRQTAVVDESELFSLNRDDYFSPSGAQVWMGDLPMDGSLYEYGVNPFFQMNLQSMAWIPRRGSCAKIMDARRDSSALDLDAHLTRRGMLFIDGKRMKQVVRPFELWEQEDVFWVDDTYKRLHLHLKNNDDPRNHSFEIAVHEQGFMPRQPGLGFLYFKNLTFEKFATPVKCPQYGALCSNCGHHFIIENCHFADINSVGVDLGFISHCHFHDGIRGYHIVRRNLFERCGIGGMSAVPTQGIYLEHMLVEHNVLRDNGFHNLALLFESAAIKSHYTHNSLYRFNYIDGMGWGQGIWLDKCNANTRICGNIVLNLHHVDHGGIFNEATLDPILVDHNLVAGVGLHVDAKGERCGGNAIYEHECEKMTVLNNILLDCAGQAIKFQYTQPQSRRFLGENRRVALCRENRAVGNYISGCSHGIALATAQDASNQNRILDAKVSECCVLDKNEHHNRTSFREIFGFESEENPICRVKMKEGEITITRESESKTLTLSPPEQFLW